MAKNIISTRQTTSDSNLKLWEGWSVGINYVVSLFNGVVQNLTDRADWAEMSIDALTTKVNNMQESINGIRDNINILANALNLMKDLVLGMLDDLKEEIALLLTENNALKALVTAGYIKLQYTNILIQSSNVTTYTQPCGVFSFENAIGGDNLVYVYSKNTVPGMYFDDNDIRVITGKLSNNTTYYLPFGSFSGSVEGTLHTIKTFNCNQFKAANELIFSFNSSILGAWPKDIRDDMPKLTINSKFVKIDPKPLEVIDDNALTLAITTNAVSTTPVVSVTKYATLVGQFSTTKTVATTALIRSYSSGVGSYS